MQHYPEWEEFLEKRVEEEANAFVDGMAERKLSINEHVTRAKSQRFSKEVVQDYHREREQVFENNMAVIKENHRQRMNETRRDGRKMGRIISPIAMLLFGTIAFFGYTHPPKDMPYIWMLYAFGVLAFAALWIISEFWVNKPR